MAATATEVELDALSRAFATLSEVEKLQLGHKPGFATPNEVIVELDTVRLRDFSRNAEPDEMATIIMAPFSGQTSVIADLHHGQSLIQTMRGNGLARVFLTDWKSATAEMKHYDIDKYLSDLNECVDNVGGYVNLIGLSQGGWMAAMFAARYPDKVRCLVLAGAPIDTDAGDGPIKGIVRCTCLSQFEELVDLGGGLMRGNILLQGWRSLYPEQEYFGKYVEIYEHMNDKTYLARRERFEAWLNHTVDLPGRWFLQVVQELFQENRLVKEEFDGLGQRLSLKCIRRPVHLLAGTHDTVTPKDQVFNAAKYLGTPVEKISRALIPGNHFTIFAGSHALKHHWPKVAHWIVAAEGDSAGAKSGRWR